MKTLLLLRHAKSDWAEPGLDDIDRPLAPRGQDAAPRMGRYLRTEGLVPDLVLCSTARRAQDTWALVAAELDPAPPVRFRKGLYAVSSAALLAAIRRVPDDCACLLLIGHNPEIEDLAHRLAGTGKAKALAGLAEKYPTAALAEIRFERDSWTKIGEGAGALRRFVRPRDLA
ncbi:MAG: histidine phosphatase family protein [Rhodospirillales bacterium]